jgi:hypothetical protein
MLPRRLCGLPHGLLDDISANHAEFRFPSGQGKNALDDGPLILLRGLGGMPGSL